VAARSSLAFAIAAPDGATAAVTATLAATVAERLIAEGPPDDLLAPVMIVVALATALTGLLLWGLGLTRAGGAIRFIPYPVIGGFLSATGWLMVSGAVRVITDHRLSLATLGTLLAPITLAQIAAAAFVALALYLGLRRARNPFVLPGILLDRDGGGASRFRPDRNNACRGSRPGLDVQGPNGGRARADMGPRRCP